MGHDSTVKLLLDYGADIYLCDKYGETPLHQANTEGLIIDYGADIN